MTAKRSEPQLIHFGGLMYMNHIAAAGWAANLDFFWPPEVQALYGEGFVNAAKSGGRFWSSGMVATKPFVLFYRPSVLQKVTGSAEPPKNYKELLEKAKMVAEKTDMYGIALPGKDHRYMWYLNAGPLYSMGGKFTTNGQYDVTSPEYRKMFTYMVNLVREGAAPEEAFGWSWTDAPETFERGRAAFLMAGTVNATRFQDQKPEAIAGDWDFVPAPGWEDKPGMSTIDGTAYWAVNTYAKDNEKAAAALFLDLYRSYQGQWNEIGFEGNECPIPAIYDMDSIKKAVYKPDTRSAAIARTGGESLPVNGDQMLKYEHEWWTKAASGEVSIDEALKNLANDIKSIAP
jgi:ABC-type glycerol-3-phosphate transport system substrate-binding protein